jgi:hypothetical protein
VWNWSDNKIDELGTATQDIEEVEQGESTPDWQQPAEQKESPTISIDDFSAKEEPSKEDTESLERKKAEQAQNAKNIEDRMFEKYVLQEDWTFNFEALPNDLKWTAKGIKERYLQEQEQPTNSNPSLNIEDIKNTLKFEQKLESLVASEDISSEDKVAIRDKYKSLKALWISNDLIALQEAESFVLNTTKPKPVWVMPQAWTVPNFSWNVITYEQLDKIAASKNQAEYNKIMDWVDAGTITLK